MRFGLFLCLLGVAGLAPAQTMPASFTRNMNFPPLGVGMTETVQINVANTASNGANAAASCTGTITFTVANAKTQPAPTKFTLTSGEIVSASLAGNTLATTGQAVVLGSIQVTQTAGTPCVISASMETYDTTSGATHVYLSNPASSVPGPIVLTRGHQ
jgi:hypothetical protein